MLDETGANGTAFIHRRISDTNHAQQIIGAFKLLRWAYPDDAIPQGLRRHEPLLTTTGHFIPCGKRMTVDDVHFECRFVKQLWSIIAQANKLTLNAIDATNTTGIS